MKIAVVFPPNRGEASALADKVVKIAEERGIEAILQPKTSVAKDIDFVFSLGGDGTVLYAAKLAYDSCVPVVGVNLGHLGYLAEVEATQINFAIEALVNGKFQIEERMTLSVGVERQNGEDLEPVMALNDAVVERVEPGRTIRITATLNGRLFVTYTADGIVVATPTGSTAYNLSVRGPIVSPRLDAMILTPISPHLVFDRPLVLEPDIDLRLELQGVRHASLLVDGDREVRLEPGDSVFCRQGGKKTKLVRINRAIDFHDTVKAKFGFGVS